MFEGGDRRHFLNTSKTAHMHAVQRPKSMINNIKYKVSENKLLRKTCETEYRIS
jgi:hypothetical protein